ncbi:MAG: ABC transporter permease subunit [Elusimicrobia bacterium]|nr:ABC transporter permease subunit [Elusimicrobiota bacterium]
MYSPDTSKQRIGLFKDTLSNYFFIIPAIAMFAVFNVYPFYKLFELSVKEWDGYSMTAQFVGFRNFFEAFKDGWWWESVWNGIYITLLALTLQNGLALVLALVVDREIRAKNFYRVVFFVPPILSGIVVGLVWKWLYNGEYGLINHWLSLIGLGQLARSWLADPDLALTSVAVVHMWKGFGWGFIILLAGLQSIPRELYEAARVDGAGDWRIFVHIIIPLMIPVFFLVSILTVLGTMQIFDIVVALTNGGPGGSTEVPIFRIITEMWGNHRFGYACTMGIIFGVMLLIVSMVQIFLSRRLRYD